MIYLSIFRIASETKLVTFCTFIQIYLYYRSPLPRSEFPQVSRVFLSSFRVVFGLTIPLYYCSSTTRTFLTFYRSVWEQASMKIMFPTFLLSAIAHRDSGLSFRKDLDYPTPENEFPICSSLSPFHDTLPVLYVCH